MITKIESSRTTHWRSAFCNGCDWERTGGGGDDGVFAAARKHVRQTGHLVLGEAIMSYSWSPKGMMESKDAGE